jgi:hypothetical protein
MLHTGHNEGHDLNPMHCVRAMTKVVFEQCIIYACIATVAAFLLPQGHFQVAAGRLWQP